jgi:hypothetical protein
MVKLTCTLSANKKSLTITGPPNAAGVYRHPTSVYCRAHAVFVVYPPGPAWVYVLFNGVPSKAQKVMIGNGGDPPLNQAATDKYVFLFPTRWGMCLMCDCSMLASTGGPS